MDTPKTLGTNVTADIYWRYKQLCASNNTNVADHLRMLIVGELEKSTNEPDEDIGEKGINKPATEPQYKYIDNLRDLIELPPLEHHDLSISDANDMIHKLKAKAFPKSRRV